MKTIIFIFVVTLFSISVVNGAKKCYLCIDDQCKSNPYTQTCGDSASDWVCVSNTYKLSFAGEVKVSKYCASISTGLPAGCKDKDSSSYVSSFYECFYCRGDMCN